MTRREVKERVSRIADIFRPFFNKKMQVQITNSGVKPFASTLEGVHTATLAMIKGLEEKRESDNGRGYSPPMFLVLMEHGRLFFPLEDVCDIIPTTSGVTVDLGEYRVLFLEMK